MPASVILFSLILALIGTRISNANPEYIEIESLPVGNCVEAVYTAPETESATLNLKAAKDGDTLLHIDYRVKWGPNTNTIVLNTKTGGSWGPEQLVTGITSTPGSRLKWVICARENDFSIEFNEKDVATYAYRISAPVTYFDFTQYPNSHSVLKKLCKIYSQ